MKRLETKIDFSAGRIRHLFDTGTWQRGLVYARDGRVQAISRDEQSISASVAGSAGTKYSPFLTLKRNASGETVFAGGVCTCPVGFDCKHVVAVCCEIARRDDIEGLQGGSMQSVEQQQTEPPLLAAVGYNFSLLLKWIRQLLCLIIAVIGTFRPRQALLPAS